MERQDQLDSIPRDLRQHLDYFRSFSRKVMDNIKIRKVVYRSFGGIGDMGSFEVSSLFRKLEGLDIVHNPIGFFVTHNVKRDQKYLATCHGLYPLRQGTKDAFLELLFRRGTNFNIRRADHIIANSTQSMKELIDIGYPADKITVVYRGLRKQFIKKKYRKRHNNRFVVGYLGTFAPQKNVGMLVEAFKLTDAKDLALKIWGGVGGYSGSGIAEMAADDDRIRFMGVCPEVNIVNTYDNFDLFVFPSKYESFGIPILEAQARGKPVIILKSARLPSEVRKYCIEVEDEEHMAEKIIDIKKNGYEADKKREAMAYARKFTWERAAKETVEVYRRLAYRKVDIK